MNLHFRYSLWAFAALINLPAAASAGMPTVTLTDVAQMRLRSISFFLAGFLLAAFLLKVLWNYLRKDWTFLPVLGYGRALVVVALWGMLFLLVLTMISGARELMTPGAWEKQGRTYKLAEKSLPQANDLDQRRRQQMERLRDALLDFARAHDGRFPESNTDTSIPSELWTLPETAGMRYLYVGGKLSAQLASPLAHEADIYEGQRYVLYSNGDIRKQDSDQLAKALREAK